MMGAAMLKRHRFVQYGAPFGTGNRCHVYTGESGTALVIYNTIINILIQYTVASLSIINTVAVNDKLYWNKKCA